jgi:hypothetical protein
MPSASGMFANLAGAKLVPLLWDTDRLCAVLVSRHINVGTLKLCQFRCNVRLKLAFSFENTFMPDEGFE